MEKTKQVGHKTTAGKKVAVPPQKKNPHVRNPVFQPLPDWQNPTSVSVPKSHSVAKTHTDPGCRCSACKDLPLALTPPKPAPLKRLPFKVGDRVILKGDLTGVIKWVGVFDEYVSSLEIYVGVHLDDPVGEHDGLFGKKRFFQCPTYHGTIVPKKDVLLVKGRNDLSYRSPLAGSPPRVTARPAPAPAAPAAATRDGKHDAAAPIAAEPRGPEPLPASAQSKAKKLLEAQQRAQEEYEQQQRAEDSEDDETHGAGAAPSDEQEGPAETVRPPRAVVFEAQEDVFSEEEVRAAREQLLKETEEACLLLEQQDMNK